MSMSAQRMRARTTPGARCLAGVFVSCSRAGLRKGRTAGATVGGGVGGIRLGETMRGAAWLLVAALVAPGAGYSQIGGKCYPSNPVCPGSLPNATVLPNATTPAVSQHQATWGSPEFAHCKLNFTLEKLGKRYKESRAPNFKTGSLARPLRQPGLYEVWVCIEEHYCSNHPTDKYFCWVLDESKAKNGEGAPGQYVPWDYNANLQIVEHSDVSCSCSVIYAGRQGGSWMREWVCVGANSSSTCVRCPPGTYSSNSGVSVCSDCQVPKYSLDAVSLCSNCTAPGFNLVSSSCTPCNAGTYSAIPGATCSPCESGKFSSAVGATDVATCSSCHAGKYKAEAGATACDNCAAGKFSTHVGATDIANCSSCPAGKYSAAGASVCTNCEAGKYQSAAGVESVCVRGREGGGRTYIYTYTCIHMLYQEI